MTKSNKLFKLLELVKANPYIALDDVAKEIGTSKRGLYRYVKTLRSVGIPIETKKGCILGKSKIEEFVTSLRFSEIRYLREALMRSQIGDDHIPRVQAVNRFLEFIAKSFPDLDEKAAEEAQPPMS